MPGLETNALLETATEATKSPPCVFVLYGATGDLAARKIAPALYNLFHAGLLDERFAVLGVARRPRSDEQFRDEMAQAIAAHSRSGLDRAVWDGFARRWFYHNTPADSPQDYVSLRNRLEELDKSHGTAGSRLHYLAMTPDTFATVAEQLGRHGLAKPPRENAFVRLVVEKPFGNDLASAGRLNDLLPGIFDESQIYRIDHYLGKETVQNLLVFRFATAIIEPILNRQYVSQVQITTAETGGMEGRRGAYYEQVGALRDMVQNHMLQVLAMIAMDAPARMTGEAVRDEKAKLLRAIQPLSPQEAAAQTVRGQYGAGKDMPAYCQEQGVAPDSTVETYAAVKLCIDNWRWAGVPFYLRTGKRLAAKASYIVVEFKREPISLFEHPPCNLRGPNRLIFRIAPDEGASLILDSKLPGPRLLLRPVKMDFQYQTSFHSASPEAYENLLLDAMMGEPALFIRRDEVEAGWKFIDSIEAAWRATRLPELIEYPPQTWGPPRADILFDDPYARWYELG